MIPEDQIKEFRKALSESAHPIIYFDDDPDGLSSFLQFYKFNREARGVIYKAAGPLDERFLKKIKTYHADKVFIVDVAEVSQEFLDKSGETYWLDHHAPLNRKNVKYYNPMIQSKGKDNRPASYWAHKITQDNLWICMVGCVGDWFLPEDLKDRFSEKYPDLLPKKINTPEDALFTTQLGKLAKVFSFVMKGRTKDAMTCVKILTRIDDPYEILEQKTSQGKYVWKKYQKINKEYQEIKNSVKVTKDSLLLFRYDEDKMALTSDLSNEILYENPDKFIIIARMKSGEFKCSLRSTKYEVLPILEKALKKVNGSGGGHTHACGANVVEEDFDKFLEVITKNL